MSEKLFSLKGKVAVVTGAARGNGEGIARAFLDAGAVVYFLDLLGPELSSLRRRIKSPKARFVTADVTDGVGMERVMKSIFDREKRLNILVNNAGITMPEPSPVYSDDKWARTQAVNLEAPFRISRIAFPYLRRSGGGVVINVTSICAELGFSDNPAYVASKGGLKQLTKALAMDWAKHNIRVNNLGLGYFRTAMTKKSYADPQLRARRSARIMLDRWGDSADLAGPAVFLASDASRYMTGQDLYIDGGFLSKGI